MKKGMALALGILFLASASNAFAFDRCQSQFRVGLLQMKSVFSRLSPACQREVNIGDSNTDRIVQICNGSEVQLALQMQSIKDSSLKPLCLESECASLRAMGVCVPNKPFSYYLGKFGL